MSLLDAITHGPHMKEDWSIKDPGWSQYLDDHISVIQRQCIQDKLIYQLSIDMIETVKQSIPQYLRYHGMNESLAWIIRLVNGIPNDWHFTVASDGSPPTLYIPTEDIIADHFNNYRATKNLTGT